MKRDYSHITSLSALKAHQTRLKAEYEQKGDQVKTDISVYVKQLSPIYLFKKYFTSDTFNKFDDKLNISGTIMSLVLPFFLNKTLFRGSGVLTKAIMGFASNRLGKKLDLDHLSSIFDKVKELFSKREAKETKRIVDYGIPPDSETY
jgi:hypothetical protein